MPLSADLADRRLQDLVTEHRSALMAQAVRLTAGDRPWAEDVVQETFIRAWRRLDRMTSEYGSVRSWLMRVTHNLVMDGHRTRRARPIEVDASEAVVEPSVDDADQTLAAVMVDQALATLSPPYRVVLEETYLRDRTAADAAAHLDLPVGTVKSRVFYGLRQLRETMAACPTS